MGARSGSTRFGFSGGGAESDERAKPPEPPRNARTVYGRDLHASGALTTPPGSVPHAPPPPGGWPGRAAAPAAEPASPADPAPARASEYRRAPAPSHSGKSNFPARAGFWGRRNSHGDIVPLTDPGLVPAGVFRWRGTLLPHLLVVLASATLSFAAVMLVMKLREPERPATVIPPPPATPSPPPLQPLVNPPAATAPPTPQAEPRAPDDAPAARARPARPRRSAGQPSGIRSRQRIPGPDDPIPPRF